MRVEGLSEKLEGKLRDSALMVLRRHGIAEDELQLEPNEPGKGYEFVNEVTGGSIPREFIKPVDQGMREAMLGGVLAGYEMVDVKAILYDGKDLRTVSQRLDSLSTATLRVPLSRRGLKALRGPRRRKIHVRVTFVAVRRGGSARTVSPPTSIELLCGYSSCPGVPVAMPPPPATLPQSPSSRRR